MDFAGKLATLGLHMKPSTARLIIASSETCSDLYWATRFYVPDPVIYFEHRGRSHLVASDLELSRARKEATVDSVISWNEVHRKASKSVRKTGEGQVLAFLLKSKGIRTLEVPAYFPTRSSEILRKSGFKVIVGPDPFYPGREIKTSDEVRSIRETIRATEAGIRAALQVLRNSRIRKGRLFSKGSLLTSDALRQVIEIEMLRNGALGQHTIVACGRQSADPHCRGFGPLFAHQPIVLDVFPKSLKTGYYGDLTRTVVKGRASDPLRKMYHAVRKAQQAGIRKIRAGMDGKKVHEAVCKTLEAEGFKTATINGKPQGFIHGTGHGLGLDVHEAPRVGRVSNILRKGTVVTVEPGLYYENLGGIRIEDDILVTAKGHEVLSHLPRTFEIP